MRNLIALLCLVGGCSATMKGIPSGWDGTHEPECDEGNGRVIADYVVAGLLMGVGLVAAEVSLSASDEGMPSTGADVVALGGLGGGLAFAISGLIGQGKQKRCENAWAQWRVGGAIGAASVHNRPGRESDMEATEAKASTKPTEPPPQPRGFYCASSPTNTSASLCVRTKSECIRTRDLSAGAVPDMTECNLVESAWCTGDLCFPTAEACDARRNRTEAAPACAQTD